MTANTLPQHPTAGIAPALRRTGAVLTVTAAVALAFVGGRATVEPAPTRGSTVHAVTAAAAGETFGCRLGRPC